MSDIRAVLTHEARTRLLAVFPPKFPELRADHVTLQLGAAADAVLPDVRQISIVGVAADENIIQALVVEVDGVPASPKGRPYHITWSWDPAQEAPAEYDPNPKVEKRKAEPVRSKHSSGMILARSYDLLPKPVVLQAGQDFDVVSVETIPAPVTALSVAPEQFRP